MKTNALALLGLVAATHALPAGERKPERRQFQIGDGNSDFCLFGNCGDSNGGPVLVSPEDIIKLLPPGVKLPPGFSFPKKRAPQYRGGGGSGGGHGRGRDDGGYGTITPDEPWQGGEIVPGIPNEVIIIKHPDEIAKPDKPDTKEPEEPEKPEKPKDDHYGQYPGGEGEEGEEEPEEEPEEEEEHKGYPGHGETPDEGEEGEEGEETPDDIDLPQVEVTTEDIIEAQQKLLIMEQLVKNLEDPNQIEAVNKAIVQTKEFLKRYGGYEEVAVPGTGGNGVLVPTKPTPRGAARRSAGEDTFKLYGAFTELVASPAYKQKDTSFPVIMVVAQLAELLQKEGYDIDPQIIGVWSSVRAGKKAKRQDGIFQLPGTCGVDDIIALETTLATIGVIYGRNPPEHIKSLRNAITAALVFCYSAEIDTSISPGTPVGGGSVVTPAVPDEGSSVVTPEVPDEGSSVVTPAVPDEGSSVVTPNLPEGEGRIDVEEPDEGRIVPEVPTRGGRRSITPIPSVPGGDVEPMIPDEVGTLDPEETVESDIAAEETVETDLEAEVPIDGGPVEPSD